MAASALPLFFSLKMFQMWEERLSIHQETTLLVSGSALRKSTKQQGLLKVDSIPGLLCTLITQAEFK